MGRKQRKVRSRTSVLSRDVDKQGSDSEVGSSRQETPGETTVVPRHSHADIRNHQNDDEDIGPVLRLKTADEKPPLRHAKAGLGHISAGAPWERVATDVIGPLPETERGNKYIIVFIDYFTKWVELQAVPDQTASTTAKALIELVVSRFGCPLSIHSDQGRNYESQIFTELCVMLQIKKTRTSARNPKGNGLVERFNRTIIQMIKSYIANEETEWDLHLQILVSAYRSTTQDLTGFTPNMLVLGHEVRTPYEAKECFRGISMHGGSRLRRAGSGSAGEEGHWDHDRNEPSHSSQEMLRAGGRDQKVKEPPI